MEYKVSEKIQKKFDTLTKDAKVQKALQFMKMTEPSTDRLKIPAPTNHEQKKAARLLEMFKERRTYRLPYRFYTANPKRYSPTYGHISIQSLRVRLYQMRESWMREDATVLSTIRALNAAGIETKGDIQFVGTAQEEGTGALKGMRKGTRRRNHHPETAGHIAMDSSLTRSLRSSVKTVLSSARASWMTQEDVRRSSQQSVR